MQKEIREYGISSFNFEILEYNIYDIDERHKLEKIYIEKYNSYYEGYNQNKGFEVDKISVRKTWTTKEIEFLTLLIKQGYSQKEIANKLNRIINSVNAKITRLKIGPRINNTWTPEKESRMLELRNEGKTQAEAAIILGYQTNTLKKRWHDIYSQTEGDWKNGT